MAYGGFLGPGDGGTERKELTIGKALSMCPLGFTKGTLQMLAERIEHQAGPAPCGEKNCTSKEEYILKEMALEVTKASHMVGSRPG